MASGDRSCNGNWADLPMEPPNMKNRPRPSVPLVDATDHVRVKQRVKVKVLKSHQQHDQTDSEHDISDP